MVNETADQLQSRHRKEQKELQGRITSKKKNATKKTRKGVNDECAELERQLKERQAEEWATASNGGVNPEGSDAVETDANRLEDQVADVETELASTSLSPLHSASEQPQAGGAKKRNRQKERLARRAAEAEAAANEAHAEASNMVDRRGIEAAALAATFREKGLTQHDIVPDGHCLFAAVADQLAVRGMEVRIPQLASGATDAVAKEPPYRTVRHAAASWMTNHPDDFEPFLDEGETLEAHVKSIRDTAEWGGMLELNALAHAYGVEIRVVQDGRTQVMQPGAGFNGGGENKVLWLAYYRHGYGLGEHYNSLRSAETPAAAS